VDEKEIISYNNLTMVLEVLAKSRDFKRTSSRTFEASPWQEVLSSLIAESRKCFNLTRDDTIAGGNASMRERDTDTTPGDLRALMIAVRTSLVNKFQGANPELNFSVNDVKVAWATAEQDAQNA